MACPADQVGLRQTLDSALTPTVTAQEPHLELPGVKHLVLRSKCCFVKACEISIAKRKVENVQIGLPGPL